MKAARQAALLLHLFFILAFGAVRAQAQCTPVVIPDANFRAFLVQSYPQVMNANQELLPCSAAVVTGTFDCSHMGIADLSGIENFTSIWELICSNNHLTTISVLPPGLQYIFCDTNNLTSIGQLPSGLRSLYLSGNPKLLCLPNRPSTLNQIVGMSDTYNGANYRLCSCTVNARARFIMPQGTDCIGVFSTDTLRVLEATGGSGIYQYKFGNGPWQSSNQHVLTQTNINRVMIRDAMDTTCAMHLIVDSDPAPGIQGMLLHKEYADRSYVKIVYRSPAPSYPGWIKVLPGNVNELNEYEYSFDNGVTWTTNNEVADLPLGSYVVRFRDLHINPSPTCTGSNQSYTVSNWGPLYGDITAVVRTERLTSSGCRDLDEYTVVITNPVGGSGQYEYSFNGGSSWQTTSSYGPANYPPNGIFIRDAANPSVFRHLGEAGFIDEAASFPYIQYRVKHYKVCPLWYDGYEVMEFYNPSGGSAYYDVSVDGQNWIQVSNDRPAEIYLEEGPAYDFFVRDSRRPDCPQLIRSGYYIEEDVSMYPSQYIDFHHIPKQCYGDTDSVRVVIHPTFKYSTMVPGQMASYLEFSFDQITWYNSDTTMALIDTSGWAYTEVNYRWNTINGSCYNDINTHYFPQLASFAATIAANPQPGCGLSDGTLRLTNPNGPKGTTGKYQYSIDGGATWQGHRNFYNVGAGTYNIQMRDSANPSCNAVLNSAYVVTQAANHLSAMATAQGITCAGTTTGSIIISNAAGGNGVYEFSIDGGTVWQTDSVFSNLASGTYAVRMREASAPTCHKVLTSSLNVPLTSFMFASISSTNVTCNGANNGSITLSNPSGGSGAPYEYSIDSGITWQASASFTNLAAGSYNVQMRSAANPTCTRVLNAARIISQPNVLNPAFTGLSALYCSASGNITVTPAQSGGQFYLNGQTVSATFPMPAAGSHTLKYKVGSGSCADSSSQSFQVSGYLSADFLNTNSSLCATGLDYLKADNPTGGSGQYEYSYDGGATWTAVDSVGGVDGDEFHILMRDAQNPTCVSDLGYYYPYQADDLSWSVNYWTDDTDCADGSQVIETDVYNGIEYSVDNGATWHAGGHRFENLPTGRYGLLARWAPSLNSGCPVYEVDSVDIFSTMSLSATVTATDVTCNSNADGIINITNPSGASSGYIYSIDGGASWQTAGLFEWLDIGTYTVLIANNNHPDCYRTLGDFDIEQPDELLAQYTVTGQALCEQQSVRVDITNPSGGSGSYEYSFDNGVTWTSQSFALILPNNWADLYIRDAQHPACEYFIDSPYIGQDDDLAFRWNVWYNHADCSGFGNIETDADPDLEYSLDSLTWFAAGHTFGNLSPGNHDVFVRWIPSLNAVCPALNTGGFAILPGDTLSAGITSQGASCGVANGVIEVVNTSGGSGSYEYSIDGGMTWGFDAQFINLPAGTYNVQVRDELQPTCLKVLNAALVLTGNVLANAPPALDAQRCGPGSLGISLPNPALTYNWYASPTDPMPAFTLSGYFDYTPSIAATTTYYVSAATGTCESARTPSTLTIVPFPVASLSASATTVQAGTPVTFTFTGSGATSYRWSLNGTQFSTAQNPSYNFVNPGTYQVTVTALNGTCSATSAAATITVNGASTALFTGTPTSGTAPLAVQFSANSPTGTTQWLWNFGDGSTSSAQNPSHTYTAAGSYNVQLIRVTNGVQYTEARLSYIAVQAPAPCPVADFSATPLTGTAPLTVNFSNLSTNASSYQWQFLNGSGQAIGSSSAIAPSYTFTQAGTYSVSLVASGPGCSDIETRTAYITVTSATANELCLNVPNQVAVGNDFTVEVWVQNVGTAVKAVNPTISYNTQHLDFVSASIGTFFANGIAGVVSNNDAAGTVSIGANAQTGQTATGSGLLYRLTFRVNPGPQVATPVSFGFTNTDAITSASSIVSLTACAPVPSNIVAAPYVWPGDANNDLIVNNTDYIITCAQVNKTGPARALQGINWQGYAAPAPWATYNYQGQQKNLMYVDASGDGVINNNDVSATIINNGLIHQKTDRVTKQAGVPELHATFNADSTLSPSVVRLSLDLGDVASPVDLLQGLGFTLSYDTTVFDANSTQVVFAGSVFGTRGTDFSADVQIDPTAPGRMNFMVGRLGYAPVSGHGPLAYLLLHVKPGMAGRTTQANIFNLTALDTTFTPLALNTGTDSLRIVDTLNLIQQPNAVVEPAISLTPELFPNPTSGLVTVRAEGLAGQAVRIVLFDAHGARVFDATLPSFSGAEQLDLKGLAAGAYIVQVDASGQLWNQKLLLVK